MIRHSFLLISAALFISLVSCTTGNESRPATKIDMESFFRNGEKSSFRISPDGNFFSYRSDYNGISNIFVQSVNDSAAVRVTNDTLRSIYIYFWKEDRIVYAQDTGGDENFQLFSVKTDGSDLKPLTPFPGVRSEIIDILNDIDGKEKELIVQINRREKEYFDPYLLNIETGELTLLYDNKENFTGWFTDNSGVIRLARLTDGVNETWHYRKSEKEGFAPMLSTTFKDTFTPASFNKDNDRVYALSNIGRDKIALVEYDPESESEVRELFSNDKFDLNSAKYDRKKQELIVVDWEAEKNEKHFFEAEWRGINENLEKEFAGYNIQIVSYDDARSKAIVFIGSDRLPGKYFIYDFKTKKTHEVANPYHWIAEDQMSHVQPISYQARDGLIISGYLTLPLGIEPKNLPVIINPHGGPWYRDSWYFDPQVQFLANRGYAVLQMNFRGSTGYGKEFWEASFKQWGKTMQDDITDGVEWLIEQGVADENRIAIYGASYGGYAALAGITFTPDLYAAAVDYVGVSNIFTLLNTIPPYWKPFLDQFHEMIGDPKQDSLLLAEVSPVFHADRIKTPLFIAQGANDPRVNKAESDQMVEALKKRGIDVEYMVKDDEGHGFLNQNNQFDFYNAMEVFLEKHLK